MKTGRMVGVLVLTGIGIGALLSYVLPDFGFGLGSGGFGNPPATGSKTMVGTTSDTVTDTVSDSTSGTSTETTVPVEDPSEGGESTEPTAPVATVFVLIDGREYLLRRGPEGKAPYKPADLAAVIEAAQAATGDDNGIRVRIAQKSSSRETTERALRMELEQAGIPGDAIRWKDEPTDTPAAGTGISE